MKLLYFLCFFLLLTSCKENKKYLVKITGKTIAVDSTINSAEKINNIIKPYREKLETEMQHVLSYTSEDLLKNDGVLQSSLGNLIADICFNVADSIFNKKTERSIDFAMFNNGGIRATISKGNITNEHIFKLMPFENELVVATISGKKMLALIHYFLKHKRAHPLSKNIQLTIDGNTYDLKINGNSFNKDKSYTVLTSDFLQSGGDNMTFFKNPGKLTSLDYKVRDAIIYHLKKTDTVHTNIDNRIIIKK